VYLPKGFSMKAFQPLLPTTLALTVGFSFFQAFADEPPPGGFKETTQGRDCPSIFRYFSWSF